VAKITKEKSVDSLVDKLFRNLDKILATAVVLTTGIPVPLQLLGAAYLTKSYYDKKYEDFDKLKEENKSYQKLEKEYRTLADQYTQLRMEYARTAGPYQAQAA